MAGHRGGAHRESRHACRTWAIPLGVLALVSCLALSRAETEAPADPPPLPVEADAVSQTLADVALALGWSPTVSRYADASGVTCRVSADRPPSRSASATVTTLERWAPPTLLDQLAEQGLPRGVFHGREAVITHPGDALVSDGRDDTVARGLVAWRCGPYILSAEDPTGAGQEQSIAEALFAAAERQALCGLPASLLILAQTDDVPGGDPEAPRAMAERVQAYYDANGYGRVDLSIQAVDADGSDGVDDWVNVGPTLAAYAGDPLAFGLEALRQAEVRLQPRRTGCVERIIVVCPAQALAPLLSPLAAATLSRPGGAAHVVELPGGAAPILVNDVVLLAENTSLGLWAHELGHTLPSKILGPYGNARLTDRYDTGPGGLHYGDVGCWDLMGEGHRNGATHGMSPAHMASYDKEATGWLRYERAHVGQDYPLTALEWQHAGDAALIVDDPLSDDPRCYYLIEARDHDAPFGAPSSGVILYQVGYDEGEGHALVDKLPQPAAGEGARANSLDRLRPTLYGLDSSDGRREITLPGGLRVTLVEELFAPYRARVRIEHCEPAPGAP